MEYELNLDKSVKYLVGASGGSDSMTLLSLCLKQGYKVVVAHVNYKLRSNADKEEDLLKKYCADNNVKVYTLYPKQDNKDNFQSWARNARYAFYKEVYDKEECQGLLLGHQLDDHIESYLMAKKRNSHGWYYGIKRETELFEMQVIRPLLEMRKKETRMYCLNNNIPFGDDESNFSDKYTRNKIRHSMVEPATDEQINQWLNEINELNRSIENDIAYINSRFSLDEDIYIKQFNMESKQIRQLIIRKYFWDNGHKQVLSKQYVDEIVNRLKREADKSGFIDIDDKFVFVYEYGRFYISARSCDYEYVLDALQLLQTPYFKLVAEGKTIESIGLSKEDFPIKIRNYHPGDKIALRIGHKKVSRFFIDRKIPFKQRIAWPVMENAKGEVVFVADIGCDVYHFSIKPSVFMVK